MSKRDDIRDRIRRTNPGGLLVANTLSKVLSEKGRRAVIVQTTDDMTAEEEEMALFEGFLKEGKSIEEASKKAKETVRTMRSIF
jgi:hypothetical protein